MQHGLGDFRGVGQMTDARFDDAHTGLSQTFLYFLGQMLGDFAGMATQRNLALFMLVIRIRGGHGAQGGFRLDVHKAFVIIDVKYSFCRIDNTPYHDGRDFNRTALQIVDLQLARFKVARAQRDFLFAVKGIVPAQTLLLHGPHVLAEQTEYGSLVRFDHIQADQ